MLEGREDHGLEKGLEGPTASDLTLGTAQHSPLAWYPGQWGLIGEHGQMGTSFLPEALLRVWGTGGRVWGWGSDLCL